MASSGVGAVNGENLAPEQESE